jgi:hypothetical protein
MILVDPSSNVMGWNMVEFLGIQPPMSHPSGGPWLENLVSGARVSNCILPILGMQIYSMGFPAKGNKKVSREA